MSSGDFVQRVANGVPDTLPIPPTPLPVTIGRWVAVIPTGVLAVLLVMFPIHWLIMIASASGDNFVVALLSAEVTERLVIALTSPFCIIYVGARVAPSHKVEAGVALAIASAILMGGVYVLAFNGGPSFSGWNSLHFGATPALNLIGIALALYQVRVEGTKVNS